VSGEGATVGWIVKRDGPCSRCGTVLRAGTEAVWVRGANKMHCVACPVPGGASTEPEAIDSGVGGRSARARRDRMAARREAELRERWGDRVGGWITKLGDEPQSTRAWAKGAAGEERLAAILAGLDGIHALHDRRVPGKTWNIDHVVVGPPGIFVIDAKHYRGQVRVRRRGSFFNPDDRLYVGSRDCTKDVDGMTWQVDVLDTAFRVAGLSPIPHVTSVLCFIGAEWPLFGAASTFKDVRIESERSIRKLLMTPARLLEADIERLARIVATALPAK
jgi:hypothetical protein